MTKQDLENKMLNMRTTIKKLRKENEELKQEINLLKAIKPNNWKLNVKNK